MHCIHRKNSIQLSYWDFPYVCADRFIDNKKKHTEIAKKWHLIFLRFELNSLDAFVIQPLILNIVFVNSVCGVTWTFVRHQAWKVHFSFSLFVCGVRLRLLLHTILQIQSDHVQCFGLHVHTHFGHQFRKTILYPQLPFHVAAHDRRVFAFKV